MVVNDNSFSVVGCVAGVTNIWVFLDVIVDFVGGFFLVFLTAWLSSVHSNVTNSKSEPQIASYLTRHVESIILQCSVLVR